MQEMVQEKASLPSGYIHWTVAVLPLGCVIFLLLGVIAFLLWRLKWRKRKNSPELIVSTVSYHAHTKSILNSEEKNKNSCALKKNRVHFEVPDSHALGQVADTSSKNGSSNYSALDTLKNKNKANYLISRHLGIKRKSNNKLQSKYPLIKPSNDEPNQSESEDLSGNTSTAEKGIADDLNSPPDNKVGRAQQSRIEGLRSTDIPVSPKDPKYSDDKLCYFEAVDE